MTRAGPARCERTRRAGRKTVFLSGLQRLGLAEPAAGAGQRTRLHLLAPGRELVAELLVLGAGGFVHEIAALEKAERLVQLAQLVVLGGGGIRQRVEPGRGDEVGYGNAVDVIGG